MDDEREIYLMPRLSEAAFAAYLTLLHRVGAARARSGPPSGMTENAKR